MSLTEPRLMTALIRLRQKVILTELRLMMALIRLRQKVSLTKPRLMIALDPKKLRILQAIDLREAFPAPHYTRQQARTVRASPLPEKIRQAARQAKKAASCWMYARISIVWEQPFTT